METWVVWGAVVLLAIVAWIFLKHILKTILVVALLVVAAIFISDKLTIKPSFQGESLDFIDLPVGFKIETFSDDLGGSSFSRPGPNPGPRMLAFKDDTVFVTVPNQGAVIALEDKDKDGRPENKKIVLEGLNNPHGIDFYNEWMYVAEEDKVIRVNENGAKQKLVDLPAGSHWTRTVRIFDNKMYITIGSSCNVCYEEDSRRSTMQECDLEGTNCKLYAKGLRNSVDFLKFDDKIYATDNGRDLIGNDIPPDELNIIEEEKDYGWPICYGQQIHDTDFDKKVYIRDPCQDTVPAFVDLQAHSAALGLEVYTGTEFPDEYRGDIFIAYHGSWNRDPPTGYKLVVIDPEERTVHDFATGWLQGSVVKGRPVDVMNFRDGLLVTDDNAGKIYRIYYGD